MQYWSAEMEKKVCERVQIVLQDPQMLAVYQKFGGEVFRRSSIFHGLDRSLKAWGLRGRCCFEVGTWNGLTAAILARYFDKVVTVDIAHNPMKLEILDFLKVKNVRCIDIADNAEKRRVANDLTFDAAYLDGDHANDTEEDFSLVRECGRVIFHEVWPHQRPVWDLVHRLPMEQVSHGGNGLALWRRQP